MAGGPPAAFDLSDYGLPRAPPPMRRERSRSASPTPATRHSISAGAFPPVAAYDLEFGGGMGGQSGARAASAAGGRGGDKEAITVCVRVRPFTVEEARDPAPPPITFGPEPKSMSLRTEDGVSHDFRFSRVFPPDSTQEDVYHFTGRPVVESVINGFNSAVICYGQTGSGKTYTMLGGGVRDVKAVAGEIQRGLIPRMMEHIFDVRDSSPAHIQYQITCSFIEIYMDRLSDLLAPAKTRELRLRERPDGTFFTKCTQVPVVNSEDVFLVIDKGNRVRSTAVTDGNARSSRSHAIFMVGVTVVNDTDGITRTSDLYLVDLAGSEKLSNIVAEGPRLVAVDPQRIKEMQRINVSLLALGNVIEALTSANPSGFVPFRSSTLTKLLRNSFGGNSRTSIVVNVSPGPASARETLAALRFGDRASAINNKPVANAHLSIEELKRQIEKAKASEAFQDVYEQQLTLVLARFKKAAVAMVSALPSGPRDSTVKQGLMRQFAVLRDAVRGYGIVKKLPPGLVTHIFSFCQGPTILTCGAVCKEWKQLASSPYLWDSVVATELGPSRLADKPEQESSMSFFIKHMVEARKLAREALKAGRLTEEDRMITRPTGGIALFRQ